MDTDILIHWLSGGIIVAQAGIILVLLLALTTKSTRVVSRNALGLGFLLVLIASAGSLFLSEVAQLPPCTLCWYQRIFMYPLVILLGVALWKGKDEIVDYVLALSWVGLAIAAFHYYGQMFDTTLLPCTATSISCGDKPFVEFGYITIPMMSLTAFAGVILLMWLHKRNR